MSDQSVHLAKWMPALEQVTTRHLLNFLFLQTGLALVALNGTQPSGIPDCSGQLHYPLIRKKVPKRRCEYEKIINKRLIGIFIV